MVVYMLRSFFFLCCLSSLVLLADEIKTATTEHAILLHGKELTYDSIASTIELQDEKGKPQASMFFTAYFKKESAPRPITFCFNGGPGSSAIWLHMGLLGPKRVIINDTATSPPPSGYSENPYTLLDATDLVFIDPIGTGFSKTAEGIDPGKFRGVQEDINSFAEFIERFLTKYDRWDSPRFLIGESYGTVRAVGLANTLHDRYFIDMNGIMLISSCLDFQSFDEAHNNYLAYILTLPSFTAASWYHKKLKSDLQSKPLSEVLNEAQKFAIGPYATALLLGNRLSSEEKDLVAKQLVTYTGLSEEYIKASSLKIPRMRFFKELLRNEKKVIGRFDSRYTGPDSAVIEAEATRDPSFDAIIGPFTSAFHQYLTKDLHVQTSLPYVPLNMSSSFEWDFSYTQSVAGLGYLQTSTKLTSLMDKNPNLGVYIASGYYDLATPYFATNQTVATLELPKEALSRIHVAHYEAGHMMYLNEASLAKMKEDLREFIQERIKGSNSYTGA